MYVPNYIPEPEEIPDNVTEQPYKVRLTFIRRVYVLHLISLLAIAGLVLLPLPVLELNNAAIFLGAFLLLLCFLRIALRGKNIEAKIATVAAPILLVVVSLTIAALPDPNLTIGAVIVGAMCATVYALLCGRDFSFIGQYFLALIASSLIIAIFANTLDITTGEAGWAIGINAAYLFYLVYDAASLLARRRLGEELAAVVDLYRDVFNIFGYTYRVIGHWRKHRIWNMPK